MSQVPSGTFHLSCHFTSPIYLAAGDNGKCAKHKQKNKEIKDMGNKISTMLDLLYTEVLLLITHPTYNQYADNSPLLLHFI